jgi:membrane protease YdiL (CAAX protease family)
MWPSALGNAAAMLGSVELAPVAVVLPRGVRVHESHNPAGAGPWRSWPLVAAIALLVVVTLLNNVIAPGRYLLWGLLGIAGLVLLARADGLRPAQWGLGPMTRRAGMAALVFAALTATVMLVGTQVPAVSDAYLDERVAGLSAGQVALAALVRAPVGTALLEELAFRGVLLAMLAQRFGIGLAVIGSSVAFGAWHIVPALGLAADNAAIGEVAGGQSGWAAAVAVVAAGLAGAFLCFLRIRYDHLIVPLAVHTTATSMGYLLAWLATGQ